MKEIKLNSTFKNLENPCGASVCGRGGNLLDNKNKCHFGVKTHNFFKAFTLAEVLVTLTILGIVASLTVPGIVKRQTERANKTKIKKALTVYETVINKIAVENGIKSINGLKNWTAGDATCENSVKYFKTTERDGCIFRTADGLWWDVGTAEGYDISRTMVSLKEENLTKVEAESPRFNAFVFITTFDKNGAIRINDVGYEETTGSTATEQETKKVHAYLNGEDFDMKISDRNCANCVVTIGDYEETYNEKGQLVRKQSLTTSSYHEYTYDDEGKLIWDKSCSSSSSCSNYLQTYDDKGRLLTRESVSKKGENLVIAKYYYDDDSDNVSKLERYSAFGHESTTENYYENEELIGWTYSNYPTTGSQNTVSMQDYDKFGNVTFTRTVDMETGEIIGGVERKITYDDKNNVVHIENVNVKTQAINSTLDYKYTYNKNNQKLTETVITTRSDGTVKTIQYCYTYDEYGNQSSRKECS